MDYKKINGPKDWSHRLIYRFFDIENNEDECPRYSYSDSMKSIALYLQGNAVGKWKIKKNIVLVEKIEDAFSIRLYFYDFLYEIHEITR